MDIPLVSDARCDNINENFLYFSIDVGMNREDAYRNFHAFLRQGDVTLLTFIYSNKNDTASYEIIPSRQRED